MYKFRSNRQCYYGPVLVFLLKRVDSDRIGVNELIDSHANTAPVKCNEWKLNNVENAME